MLKTVLWHSAEITRVFHKKLIYISFKVASCWSISFDEFRGAALEYNRATIRTCTRADINDVVSVSEHAEVVFDDDDRLAVINQLIKKIQQGFHISEVQACGGLIQNKGGGLVCHVGGELQTLAFTAGQRGERLAEGDVAEADVDKPLCDLCRRQNL